MSRSGKVCGNRLERWKIEKFIHDTFAVSEEHEVARHKEHHLRII